MLEDFSFRALTAALGGIALVAMLLFAVGSADNARAATAPGLGGAASYGVLAGSTVTNTGATVVDADVGVSPGSAITGFPPGILTGGGVKHASDAHAGLAQSGVTAAYIDLAGQACNFNLTGQDLGGMTLIEGAYCFSTSAQLTGALTLNAQGNADAVWVFQIGSTLTTASNALVDVINGGNDCNVFWQIGTSATLGTDTTFVGNILADASITLTTGADISGRALAMNGAVTLDGNNIGFSACAVATATPTAVPTAPPTAAPTAPPTATPVGQTPPPVTSTPSPTPVGETPPPATPTPVAPSDSPTPVGQTPPPVTPTPSPTPVGETPSPTPFIETPSPTPTTTETPSPSPTGPTTTEEFPLLPPPAQTNTPSPTPVTPGFPPTGGPPGEESFPWTMLLFGLALSGAAAGALFMSRRSPGAKNLIR